MAKPYSQLGHLERKRIEEGLNMGLSFTKIAEGIGRSTSTVSREVFSNRIRKRFFVVDRRHCKEAKHCQRKGICKEKCPYKGRELCSECTHKACTEVCPVFKLSSVCPKLNCAPWVCNGCARKGICKRRKKDMWLYLSDAADAASASRRKDARCGIDMDPQDAACAIEAIHEHISRGLSPYEISIALKDTVGKSPSTIYRWIERGYGDMCNLELERKVGFKKRKAHARKVPTRHTSKRCHDEFLKLDDDIRATRLEMDTVLGKRGDEKCILTLYHVPTKFQFALLLEEKTEDAVLKALKMLKDTASENLINSLFRLVLTDNGSEFANEYRLSRMLGERRGDPLRLYFCDARASQQKASCEKNHTELRQILRKGAISFDELNEHDLAVVMSHANSNPRASLCGSSPIKMFLAMFGSDGKDLLDSFGVECIPTENLTLKPWILNIERERRGEDEIKIKQ